MDKDEVVTAKLKAIKALAAVVNFSVSAEDHSSPAKVRMARCVMPVILDICNGKLEPTEDALLLAVKTEAEKVYGKGLGSPIHEGLAQIFKA